MAIRVCPLCQAEFLEFKATCTHCNVALLDPSQDIDPRQLDEGDQVIYEFQTWPLDARTDAAVALAESGIPHAWDGTDVILPNLHEDAADRLFEPIEERYGLAGHDDGQGDDTHAGADDDEEGAGETEYDLALWEVPRRIELVEQLVHLGIGHRWEDALLIVSTVDDHRVDAVLDDMEGVEGAVTVEPTLDPAGVLSALFLAAERMRKGKVNVDEYSVLLESLEGADAGRVPFGLDPAVWAQAIELAEDLADAVADDTDELESVAQELYDLLRPLV